MLPALLTLLAAAAFLSAFGAQQRQILIFAAYEGGFVLLPGCLSYVALVRPRQFGLCELAIGWALGYALELGAFMGTAALDLRDAFIAYPLAVAIPALVWRRSTLRTLLPSYDRLAARAQAVGWAWAASAMALIVLAYLGEKFLVRHPLPGTVAQLSWEQDITWQLSIAAEAVHHWPITWPSFAGVPLEYHFFSAAHMGAVAQTTGIPVYVVGLRLVPVAQLLAVVVGFVALGRTLGATPWAGVLGAGLFALIGFSDPGPQVPASMLVNLFQSASFLLGLLFLLAILTVLAEWLRALEPAKRRARGEWLVLAALLAAVSGSKGSVLPVVGAGLGAVVLVALLRREPARTALTALVLTTVIFAVSYVVLFGGNDGLLVFDPFATIEGAQPLASLADDVPDVLPLQVVFWALGGTLVLAKWFALLLPGLAVVAAGRAGGWSPAATFLSGAAVLSLVPLIAYTDPGNSQIYFPFYGWVALAALSAVGLTVLVRGAVRAVALPRRWWPALGLMLVALWGVERPLDTTPKETWRAIDGQVTWSEANSNLTPPLFQGMRWVQRNTDPDDVFAVATRFQDVNRADPRYCYFTALAERRAYVECSIATTYTVFPDGEARLRVNDAIFAGDRSALRRAVREAGVDYVAVDLVHGVLAPRVAAYGPAVFSNEALVVIDVRGTP